MYTLSDAVCTSGRRVVCRRDRVRIRPVPALRRVGRVDRAARHVAPRPHVGRDVRPIVRGARPVARDGHRHLDGRTRHEARTLGRRQHPRRRAHRHGRRLPPAPTPGRRPRRRRRDDRARCCARGRSTWCRAVNPDGAEWVLADRPRFRRSSVRPWPFADAHRWPGLHEEDVDGDGRILQMRFPDPDGPWILHPDDERLLVPVPLTGVGNDVVRYRVLDEGTIEDFDGFDIPSAPAPEGLDLNRNFPAGWGTSVPGSGDHPLSEPEIDALVRAIIARPNICGFNAFHTSGGVILRPSSTQPDSKLPPGDVWTWKQFAEIGTAATGYPSYSVYEDFTWDPTETMSGASDDWAYEHLGIFGWTTEFWDIVHAATGEKQSTHFWYTGPTDGERLAVLRWLDEHSTDEERRWVRRLVPLRPSAARPGRTRWLERSVLLDQPAADASPRRGRRPR